jgi:hypothetical protein
LVVLAIVLSLMFDLLRSVQLGLLVSQVGLCPWAGIDTFPLTSLSRRTRFSLLQCCGAWASA